MSTPGVATPTEFAEPPKSFFERFIGVFISPGETFADIARKPDFIAPLVLVVLSAVAVNETMLMKIGAARITRAALEQSSLTSRMTQEQKDQAVEASTQGWHVYSSHISPVILLPVILLIFTAIGLGIANAVFGAQINFKTALAVTSYAHVVGIVGALMAIPLMLYGDPENFRLATPVPSSVGFFMNPQETSKVLYAFATRIDIILLWTYALLGIGFTAVCGPKAKVMPVLMSFMGVWLVFTLIGVAFAAAFG